jgi:solute carrier family 25 oxoglutarate transporter 11
MLPSLFPLFLCIDASTYLTLQVMKVQAGASRPSSFTVLMGVIKNEGFATIYTGLSAGLLRQATYTTTRLGKQVLLKN